MWRKRNRDWQTRPRPKEIADPEVSRPAPRHVHGRSQAQRRHVRRVLPLDGQRSVRHDFRRDIRDEAFSPSGLQRQQLNGIGRRRALVHAQRDRHDLEFARRKPPVSVTTPVQRRFLVNVVKENRRAVAGLKRLRRKIMECLPCRIPDAHPGHAAQQSARLGESRREAKPIAPPHATRRHAKDIAIGWLRLFAHVNEKSNALARLLQLRSRRLGAESALCDGKTVQRAENRVARHSADSRLHRDDGQHAQQQDQSHGAPLPHDNAQARPFQVQQEASALDAQGAAHA